MLFTPWLSSVRGRLQFAKRFRKSRRALKTTPQPPVELLEDRTLLTSPDFISITPNVGPLLLTPNNQTPVDFSVSPDNMTLQVNPGQVLDAASLGGIQIMAAGYDDGFTPASGSSDFGTSGAVAVEFTAARVGALENDTALVVRMMDLSNLGQVPRVDSITQVFDPGKNKDVFVYVNS